jgi:cell division protein FtsB
MSVVDLVRTSKSVSIVAKKEKAFLINWLLVLLIGLIAVTLGMQVLLSVKTEALRQKAQVLSSESTSLKNKNMELTAALSAKFNPQEIEKFAREKLGMEYAIIAPQTNVVFLNDKDIQALAEAGTSANNGATAP